MTISATAETTCASPVVRATGRWGSTGENGVRTDPNGSDRTLKEREARIPLSQAGNRTRPDPTGGAPRDHNPRVGDSSPSSGMKCLQIAAFSDGATSGVSD
jgi:hypothetical protein